MQMTLRTRLPLLFVISAVGIFASTISFLGPNFPVANTAKFGLQCNPAVDIGCVIGDPATYAPFSASITQPTASNSQYILTIQTNYGDPAKNLIPGIPDVVPSFVYESALGNSFFIGDFIMTVNGAIYGVVLHPHDGYAAGSLYLASGYQTSSQLLTGKAINIPNPNGNVLIAAGGTLAGVGTLTGAQTGNATTTAKYTLTDQFSAPANFLPTGTNFGIYFTSYACANGVLTGSGSFTGAGGGGQVPEPGTLALCAPILLLLAGFQAARRRMSQQAA